MYDPEMQMYDPEENLSEVLTQLLDKGGYDKAGKILKMVRPTFSRYDEFKKRLDGVSSKA